jgi:glycine/D-amino acid oxidase-like deaminating enzyme
MNIPPEPPDPAAAPPPPPPPPAPRLDFDVIVIGGGVVGAAIAWRCASYLQAHKSREGGSGAGGVLLLEQYPEGPGHTHGSSHGDGRIYR